MTQSPFWLGLRGAIPGIEVGTAVLLPALRNPVVLAQQLATVDQLAEGRLIVGAGIAPDTPGVRAEFAAAGVPFDGRVGRYMEGVRLCRELWDTLYECNTRFMCTCITI